MPPSASSSSPEYRAGGTDVSERRRSGVSRGALVDIGADAALAGVVSEADGSTRIGALTTIEVVARDANVLRSYRGLAAAAAALATPQIRRMATVGGNLAQRNRCWYFRHPHFDCLKKGGDSCPARDGNHLYGVAFDLGPCVAPHPSTMAAALVLYEARLVTNQRADVSVEELMGDGRAAAADNALRPEELITRVILPPPVNGERAGYKRAIGRAHAEWPLVELVVRAVLEEGKFARLQLAAGGVAPIPLRLRAAEAAGLGAPVSAATIGAVAAAAAQGANPLPGTRYKLDLLQGLVRDLLETVARDPG